MKELLLQPESKLSGLFQISPYKCLLKMDWVIGNLRAIVMHYFTFTLEIWTKESV